MNSTDTLPGPVVAAPAPAPRPLSREDGPTFPEAEKRLPTFDEDAGTWIELADGQPWLFVLPTVWFAYSEDVPEGVVFQTDQGDAYDSIFNAMEMGWDFKLAAMLLRQSYSLTGPELGRLLRWRIDREPDELRDAVRGAINGRPAPKA